MIFLNMIDLQSFGGIIICPRQRYAKHFTQFGENDSK